MEFKDSDYCFGCSQTNSCGLKFKIVQTLILRIAYEKN